MIRFERVALRHFKNIDQGEISFPHTDDLENSLPSIIGIYGQNGSGKSSVVEAFALLQRLMSGSSLPSQAADYFQPGADSYKIELQIRLTDADDASSGKQQFDYRLIYDVESPGAPIHNAPKTKTRPRFESPTSACASRTSSRKRASAR